MHVKPGHFKSHIDIRFEENKIGNIWYYIDIKSNDDTNLMD